MRRELKAKKQNVAHNMKDNPKVFLKYVNEKLTKRTSFLDLYMNSSCSIKTRSDREKMDVLANYMYFNEVFTEEPTDQAPRLPTKQVPVVPYIEFSASKIKTAIKKLSKNKAPGPHGLNPRVIKEGCEQLAEPLEILFEHSFHSGNIPTDWRLVCITAIFKQGDHGNPGVHSVARHE